MENFILLRGNTFPIKDILKKDYNAVFKNGSWYAPSTIAQKAQQCIDNVETQAKETAKIEIQAVKSIDIVAYINTRFELTKKGANHFSCCPFHSEKSPSFSVSETKQVARCHAGCNNGRSMDVIDFVQKIDNLSFADAVQKLKDYAGLNTTFTAPAIAPAVPAPAPKKNESLIKLGLKKKAYALTQNHKKNPIFKLYKIEEGEKTTMGANIAPAFQKLFEHKNFFFTGSHLEHLRSLKNIVAYDTFYKCPAILIRDSLGDVVDIVKYRPIKPSHFTEFTAPKYFYLKESEKLNERGENFLYPFSIENDALIEKHKFLIIGEGLKNAVVARLFNVPFISIESSSTNINKKLQEYIHEKLKKGYKITGAFDGDSDAENENIKGLGAYNKTKKVLDVGFSNLFSFDSGLDFADYMAGTTSLIGLEKKFNQLFLNVSF